MMSYTTKFDRVGDFDAARYAQKAG